MDDNTNELSKEDILRQIKESVEEISKKYTFSMDRMIDNEINEYIENIKKLDYVEDAYRDPEDPKMIKIIGKKPITVTIFDLEAIPQEGEQQDG